MKIQNSNGREYYLLWETGGFSLLRDIEKDEFIVALCLEEHEDVYSWGQGRYFIDLPGALNYFLERTEKEEDRFEKRKKIVDTLIERM